MEYAIKKSICVIVSVSIGTFYLSDIERAQDKRDKQDKQNNHNSKHNSRLVINHSPYITIVKPSGLNWDEHYRRRTSTS